jgi:transcriptional regulator with XRE-family HTH domain
MQFFALMTGPAKSPAELQRELGAALRTLRINRRLTQAEVAAKAGVALRSLATLERAGNSSLETFVRTLNALQAADVIAKLAPQPQVSPLAMLRNQGSAPRRVRHRSSVA